MDQLPDLFVCVFQACDESTGDWQFAFEVSFNMLRLSATGKGFSSHEQLVAAMSREINRMLGSNGYETIKFSRSVSSHAPHDSSFAGKRFARLTRKDFDAIVALFNEHNRKGDGAKD